MEAQTSHAPNLARARKWKIAFITLTCTTLFFYILGGALAGSGISCSTSSSLMYNSGYYSGGVFVPASTWSSSGGDCGKFYGGCAMVAIASVSFVLWLVFLILRFTSWYRKPAMVVEDSAAETSQPVYTHEARTIQHVVPPVEQGNSPLCTSCGRPVNGAFCGNCGTKQT